MNKSSFFNTVEYNNYIKCVNALGKKKTEKNFNAYIKWFSKSIVLCDESFNGIGWDKNKADYQWAKEIK